jgi:prepilin-type N-terminal cleavage/methylation domain-containing protein
MMKSDFKKGFTLVEVIVTIFVFSLLAVGLVALISNMFTNSNKQSLLLSGSDQARKVANGFTNEMRNATTGNTGAYSIGQADNQTLVFYSNIDNAPDIERIRYFVQSGTLRKGVTKYSGGTYNPANETLTLIQNDLGNGATPVFYYYDGNYDGTTETPLTQPVNLNQIKYVKINLMIINRGGQTNSRTYTVTAGAAVRNLKTNLGS